MFWQEDEKTAIVDAAVVDVTFKANAKCLPVDHAYALSSAVLEVLPWIKDEPQAGIHLMYGADSGNGWERPDSAEGLIYLSRRTRFGVRIPKSKLDEVENKLTGQILKVAGNQLTLEDPHVKPLAKHSAIYSRNIVVNENLSEKDFLQYAVKQLKTMGIMSKKIMGGKASLIKHPEALLHTRSLLLVELNIGDSLKLQANGLGDYKFMGCGIFIPHKTVEDQKLTQTL